MEDLARLPQSALFLRRLLRTFQRQNFARDSAATWILWCIPIKAKRHWFWSDFTTSGNNWFESAIITWRCTRIGGYCFVGAGAKIIGNVTLPPHTIVPVNGVITPSSYSVLQEKK